MTPTERSAWLVTAYSALWMLALLVGMAWTVWVGMTGKFPC